MKIKIKDMKYISFFLLLMVTFTSCIKNDFEDLGESGTPRIFLSETPDNIQYFSPFTGVQVVDLVTVRREEVSERGINEQFSVNVEHISDSLDEYNEANGSTFEPMPDDLYTVVSNGVTKNGNTFNVTFAPGVSAVTISVAVDGSKWDVSKTYAFYFKILDGAGKEFKSDHIESLAGIAIKNKWDGVYAVTGTMTDVTSTSLTHINNFLSSADNDVGIEAPLQIELRTTGPNTCVRYDNYFFGGYFIPITSDATYSQYGSFDIIIEFDPATDKIVNVTNYYGQPAPANGRYATLDPSGENAFDAATRNVKIKFNMNQPASVPVPPHIRTTWDETWEFLGDR